METLIRIGAVILIVLAWISVGGVIVDYFGIGKKRMRNALLAIGFGAGAHILFVYLLAVIGILNGKNVGLGIGISLAIGFYCLIKKWRRYSIWKIVGLVDYLPTQRIGICCAVILVLFGGVNLIGALAPVTDGDGLAYHLAMPKMYIEHQGFVYHPLVVSNWPMTIDTLFMEAMAVSDGVCAKLIHWLFGALSAILVYLIARTRYDKESSLIGTVAFYSIPMVALESGIAYIDNGFVFFFLLGWMLFLEWWDERWETNVKLGRKKGRFGEIKLLYLSALLLGIAASTKWNGPFVVVITFVFMISRIAWENRKNIFCLESLKKVLKTALIFIGISILFSLLWYCKNYYYTGNPVVPYLGEVLQTKNWSPENTIAYKASVAASSQSLEHFIKTPFLLTLGDRTFGELTFIGPILLALVPLGLFLRREWIHLLFALIFYVMWFFTSPQSRFLMPLFGILAVVVAGVVAEKRYSSLRKVFVWLVLLSAVLNLVIPIAFHLKAVPVVFGFETESHYLERVRPLYGVIEWANTNLPDGSRTLFVGEIFGYWYDHEYLWECRSMQAIIDYQTLTPETFYAKLKVEGFNSILVNDQYNNHCPNADNLLSGIKDKTKLVYEKGTYKLYVI